MKTVFLPLGDKPVSQFPVQYAIDLAEKLEATLIISRLYKEYARSSGLLEGNPTVADITAQNIT